MKRIHTSSLCLRSPHKRVKSKPDISGGDVVWTGVADATVCVYHCNTEAGLVIRIPRHGHTPTQKTSKQSDFDRQRNRWHTQLHIRHICTGSCNYPDTLTSSFLSSLEGNTWSHDLIETKINTCKQAVRLLVMSVYFCITFKNISCWDYWEIKKHNKDR